VPALVQLDQAAGDPDDLAGDLGGGVRQQPHHHRGDIRRVERVEGALEVELAEGALGHGRPGPGGDGVHPHAVAGQLEGADDGEAGHPGLGRPVVGLAQVAQQARGRGGVDDRPGLAPLLPPGGGVPGHGEGGAQVDPDHEVELLGGHVEHHAVADHPGVVDQAVQAAEGVRGRGHQPPGGLKVADVVLKGEGPPAGGGDRRGRVGRPGQVVDHHRGPGPGAGQRLLAPDALPGPGDDHHLAVQRSHGSSRRSAGPWNGGLVHHRRS
jgi:hypothetical protein